MCNASGYSSVCLQSVTQANEGSQLAVVVATQKDEEFYKIEGIGSGYITDDDGDDDDDCLTFQERNSLLRE